MYYICFWLISYIICNLKQQNGSLYKFKLKYFFEYFKLFLYEVAAGLDKEDHRVAACTTSLQVMRNQATLRKALGPQAHQLLKDKYYDFIPRIDEQQQELISIGSSSSERLFTNTIEITLAEVEAKIGGHRFLVLREKRFY